MITPKLSWTRVAAVAVLVAAAPFVLAQSAPQRGTVPNGTVVQTGPIVQSAPVSRPVDNGLLHAPSGGVLVASPLSEAECTGIGGKVIDVATSSCASARQCVTANDDNTIHYKCISKQ